MPRGKKRTVSQKNSSNNASAKRTRRAVCRQLSPNRSEQSPSPPGRSSSVGGTITEAIQSPTANGNIPQAPLMIPAGQLPPPASNDDTPARAAPDAPLTSTSHTIMCDDISAIVCSVVGNLQSARGSGGSSSSSSSDQSTLPSYGSSRSNTQSDSTSASASQTGQCKVCYSYICSVIGFVRMLLCKIQLKLSILPWLKPITNS